jgi:RNA recognition motif-containing protein
MNIYVGNLHYEVTENVLRNAFEEYGSVASVTVIKDKETGRSKGFAFVEMTEEAEGKKALQELDGATFKERPMRVSEARPKEENSNFRNNNTSRRSY